MPSISALLKIALYWLVWGLVARRLLQGHAAGEAVSTACWLVGTAAIVVWFTWIKFHDDKQARLHRDDAESAGGPASPASRFVGAVALGAGGTACLLFGALLPDLRTPLLILGLFILMAAMLFLFFGRRSRSYDIDS
jgi:hypothetical protein